MKKKVFCVIIIFFLIAILPYIWVEVNTVVFYDETVDMYKLSTMISSDNYHKVIYYSKNKAKVLYCDPINVMLCDFVKNQEGMWECNDYKSVFRKGALTEADFYPIYPTKHLILPEESKDNFYKYQKEFEDFAELNNLEFSVTVEENGIDRTVYLVSHDTEITIDLYNDYDGLSGCESAEIMYSTTTDFNLDLFTQIQNCCIQKTISKSESADFLESADDSGFVTKNIKETFPDYTQAKSKDVLGNGEYVVSYIKMPNKEILHLKGLTKR